MSPTLPQDDLADVGLGYPEDGGKTCLGFASGVPRADFQNLGVREFGVDVGFTGATNAPSACAQLVSSVSGIVHRSSEPQVFKEHTRRVIAVVKHEQPSGDWPLRCLPSQAVGTDVPTLAFNAPVSVFVPVSLPLQAVSDLEDVNLQPINQGNGGRTDTHLGIAVLPPASPMTVAPATGYNFAYALRNGTCLHSFSLAQMVAI